jgi:hypothetical protein
MSEHDIDDPQPGDFDAELEAMDPKLVQHLEPSPNGEVVLQVIVRGEAADILWRLAEERGELPSEIVASLLLASRKAPVTGR